MSETKITSNQIEEMLLNREIERIGSKLKMIGEALIAIVKPYYTDSKGIKGLSHDDFNEWLKKMMFVNGPYYTSAIDESPYPHVPDKLRAAIVKKVVADFLDRVADIEEIAAEVAEGRY